MAVTKQASGWYCYIRSTPQIHTRRNYNSGRIRHLYIRVRTFESHACFFSGLELLYRPLDTHASHSCRTPATIAVEHPPFLQNAFRSCRTPLIIEKRAPIPVNPPPPSSSAPHLRSLSPGDGCHALDSLNEGDDQHYRNGDRSPIRVTGKHQLQHATQTLSEHRFQ